MNLKKIVQTYIKHNQNEKSRLSVLMEFLDKYDDQDAVLCKAVGHVTVSALVISMQMHKVLLFHNPKWGRYLQPGGHLRDTNVLLQDAAKQKVTEEIGITGIRYVPFHFDPALPIDIDIHPGNVLDEPPHLHFDFRYAFFLDDSSDIDNSSSLKVTPFWKTIAVAACDQKYKNLQ